MKIFIAKNATCNTIEIYKTADTIITSGIYVPVEKNNFSNAHQNCANCENLCTLLKEKFQLHLCDMEDAGLEFRVSLNLATMIFSMRVDGEVLEALCTYFGLEERTWIIVQFEGTKHFRLGYEITLPKLASQKARIQKDKGKFFCQEQMNCPPDWINFFIKTCEQDDLRAKFSVILGVDNMEHCPIPLQLQEQNNIVDLNMSILEKQISTDLILTSDNGTKFPCHRSFLEAHSTTFEAMLKDKKFVEGETGMIVMDDMTEDGVKAFLKFLYHRDTKEPAINPWVAMELLTCGNKYGINILIQSMSEILLGKPTDWFDLSTAMRLFYYGCQVDEGQSEFKRKSIQVLRLKSLTEIENSRDYNQLFSENAEAAKELCTTLLSHLSLNK